jgi:CPA2 family monovalent cation:H+ antiporter-2
MLLAELGIRERFVGEYTHAVRAVLARVIPLATLAGLAVLVGALGSTILPSRGIALTLVAVVIGLAIVLWRGLVKVHARLQATLRDTLEKPDDMEQRDA